MQFLYFTLVAGLLYLITYQIVEHIELTMGRRLENRSLLFFAILLVLSLVTFRLIRTYTGNP